jgi:rod shape determining protein RodA
LPWLSYGRSAMLVNFIALGLCASVARRGRPGQGRW